MKIKNLLDKVSIDTFFAYSPIKGVSHKVKNRAIREFNVAMDFFGLCITDVIEEELKRLKGDLNVR